MFDVDRNGIELNEQFKQNKNNRLINLMLKPFDPNNTDHIEALKQYNNEFEYNLNLMYLYQGLSLGIIAWGGYLFIGFLFPIPTVFSYLFSAGAYLGVSGVVLGSFSMNDFCDTVQRMKTLYNWCLKDSKDIYSSSINNNSKLAVPEVQRLISLLAPFCAPDFMIAWPKLVNSKGDEANASYFGWFSSKLSSAFSSAQKIEVQNKIEGLKSTVEMKGFDTSVMVGFKQALNYFTTNQNFRDQMKTIAYEKTNKVKDYLQPPIRNMY